jgi:uncharacterized membrane protein YbhN (UPF0104 family)
MNSSRLVAGKSRVGWWLAFRKHWQLVAHWLVVAAAVGYLAWVAPGLVADAGRAIRQLDHLRWGWLAVAVLCGVAALVVYGELHRQLLLVGRARVSVAAVQSINFVENAVSVTVPVVGGAGALAYAIDQLRRRRVDATLASWSVLAAGVISGHPARVGLAETSLLAVLLASGVAAGPAAASVLIYRSITWLGMALVGWALYALSIHTSPLHIHRCAPEVAQV